MKTEQIRITDEQRKSLKEDNPTMEDICTLGETKCVDGHVYVCQIGPGMKPDWFFTNELCGNLQTEVYGNIVVTTQINILSTSRPETFQLIGTIGEASPKVMTKDMPSIIQSIVGFKLTIPGLTKFSGTGTTTLVLEFWANGTVGYPYKGEASCTVILK